MQAQQPSTEQIHLPTVQQVVQPQPTQPQPTQPQSTQPQPMVQHTPQSQIQPEAPKTHSNIDLLSGLDFTATDLSINAAPPLLPTTVLPASVQLLTPTKVKANGNATGNTAASDNEAQIIIPETPTPFVEILQNKIR